MAVAAGTHPFAKRPHLTGGSTRTHGWQLFFRSQITIALTDWQTVNLRKPILKSPSETGRWCASKRNERLHGESAGKQDRLRQHQREKESECGDHTLRFTTFPGK
jgi:hypothetical protein